MAKIKKVQVQSPRYYAHYDAETDQIFSVNNFRNSEHHNAVEISYEEYERLVTGKDHLKDFSIGKVIRSDGILIDGLISKKIIQEHNLKKGVLSYIKDDATDEDINVHCHGRHNQWLFTASESFKKK